VAFPPANETGRGSARLPCTGCMALATPAPSRVLSAGNSEKDETGMRQQFASDNNAGICPAALAAMIRANDAGHATSYGDDPWTREAAERIGALFETECEVFFVFNGTAANALALAHLCRPYHAIICHEGSHIAEDECSAPEFFSGGAKLLIAKGPRGKLLPDTLEELGRQTGRVHGNRPAAVSLTQATEMGTVYTRAELQVLAGVAKRLGLKVHLDGARFANAVATLACSPAGLSWRAGIDVLSFGGTKNGLAFGEALVFFDAGLAEEFAWRRKQAGQLNSKMRLLAAPWIGLLEGNVWLENARHANAMARRLSEAISRLPGVRFLFPVEANAVFADIHPELQAAVRAQGWRFYTFLGQTGCRLMCAWDTTPETVDRFAADLAAAAERVSLTSSPRGGDG
jgi:threonine aldolase